MSIFKYLTISHLQKVLAALETRFLGIENDVNNVKNEVDVFSKDTKKGNFYVTLTTTYNDEDIAEYSIDKTFDEILNAFNEGRDCYLKDLLNNYINILFFSGPNYFYAEDISFYHSGQESGYTASRLVIRNDNSVYVVNSPSDLPLLSIDREYGEKTVYTLLETTITPTYNEETLLYEATVVSDLWNYLLDDYEFEIITQRSGEAPIIHGGLCNNHGFEFANYKIQANPDNTVLIQTNLEGTHTITIESSFSLKTKVRPDYLRSIQSDWNEEDMGNTRYIDNKPAIKAGEGENSVLIGQIEQDEDAQVFDIAISTSGSTTSVSYTSDSTITLPSTTWYYYVLSYEAYGVTYYREIESIDTENHIINTSSNVAGTHDNLSAKLYYKHKISGGKNSYAEGYNTVSGSTWSHAEGWYSKAIGSMSHAEGYRTSAISSGSHSEGNITISKGTASHSEGIKTVASGSSSHAEGQRTTAQRRSQHVFGEYNILDTTGSNETVKGSYVEIVGNGTSDDARSNARTLDWSGNEVLSGKLTVGAAPTADMDAATKKYVDDMIGSSISQSDWNENDNTNNSYILNKPAIKAGDGENSVLIGQIEVPVEELEPDATLLLTGIANATTYSYTTESDLSGISRITSVALYNGKYYYFDTLDRTNNTITFIETISNTAITDAEIKIYKNKKIVVGSNSVAEGIYTLASGDNSHAEGKNTRAIGSYSHAEGLSTSATINSAHAEGMSSVASGLNSHAEGMHSIASGGYSHAEGVGTKASGNTSHAEGSNTIAASSEQHVQGKCNIEDSNNVYAHIVGNGSSKDARSNAHTLDWNGNGWYAGKLTVGTAPTNDMDVATKKYVDDNANSLFIVTITSTTTDGTTTYSADKTFSEILAYINSSHNVVCKYYDNIHQLVQFSEDSILFSNASNYMDEEFNVVEGEVIYIYNDDTIFVTDTANTTIPMFSSTMPLMDGVAYKGDDQFHYALADHVHPTDTTRAAVSDVLTKTNTTSYTPTSDYHPATKKYVDDATAGITSDLSSLTDTTISSPVDGQLLKYNATTSKWENVTLSLAIDNGVIQLKEGNTVISSVTLPIYNGGVS